MNRSEMLIEFYLRYDKNATFQAASINKTEAYRILTNAEERFIKTHYNPLGNKYRKGFEYDEKRRKDLSELTKISNMGVSSINSTTNIPNGYYVTLPPDFMWCIGEDVTVNYTTCTNTTASQIIKVKPVTHDEYNVNLRNPFKKPFVEDGDGLAWRLDVSKENTEDENKRHLLITDGSTITNYRLSYISRPKGITSSRDCSLDESTHSEIVDIAVAIALENTQEARWQTNKIENSNNE